MSALRELIIDNPMLVEIRRVRSRMISTRSGGSNTAVIGLILFFYVCFVLALFRLAEFLDPVLIVIFQTALFSLLMPVMVSSAIAGERENRTWDILLVTPVTKAQIVIGKFIACLSGLGIFFVMCAVPVFICYARFPGARFSTTVSAELVSGTFGMFLIAFSLLVSARSRTTFAALGSCVGVIFVVFGALPIFIASVIPDPGDQFLTYVYPFSVLGVLVARPWQELGEHLWRVPLANSAVYLVLSVLMLIATTATVRKMEEIKNVMPETEGKRRKERA